MNAKHIDSFRRLLIGMRDALVAEGDVSVEADGADDVVRKPDEDAAPLAEMNQVIASKRNQARVGRLHEIESAMRRLDEDPEGFGCCEDCDEEIPRKRLELMPWARLCIECQNQRETRDAPVGRRHLTDYK